MRTIILLLVVSVSLALLAVPASAAPPVQSATWAGSGVTQENQNVAWVIPDARVRFSGNTFQAADGSWRGQGTFVDRTNNREVHLVVGRGYTDSPLYVQLYGDAQVTVDGTPQAGRYVFFLQIFQQYLGDLDGTYQSYFLDVMNYDDWQDRVACWIAGFDILSRNAIRIR